MTKPPDEFHTARFHLRPPLMSDAEAIFVSYAQDEQVTKYVPWTPHSSIDETNEFVQRCIRDWEEESAFPWAIIRIRDNCLLGMVEIRIQGHRADLGYVIAQPDWSKGYATEAVQAVVSWAIKQPKIMRVWALCDVDNLASARVLEKVGMEQEGVLRRFIVHPTLSKEPRDVFCFALIK
jgi:RimJ/RimL family protein N-acetyltransferase